jgi:hypothetical protein
MILLVFRVQLGSGSSKVGWGVEAFHIRSLTSAEDDLHVTLFGIQVSLHPAPLARSPLGPLGLAYCSNSARYA